MKYLTVNDVLDCFNKEAGHIDELNTLIMKFNSSTTEAKKDLIYRKIELLMDSLNDRDNTSYDYLLNGKTTLRYEFGNVYSSKYREQRCGKQIFSS